MIGDILQVPHDGTDGIAKSRVENFFRNRLEVDPFGGQKWPQDSGNNLPESCFFFWGGGGTASFAVPPVLFSDAYSKRRRLTCLPGCEPVERRLHAMLSLPLRSRRSRRCHSRRPPGFQPTDPAARAGSTEYGQSVPRGTWDSTRARWRLSAPCFRHALA